MPLLLCIWIGTPAISMAGDEVLWLEGKDRVWRDATGKYQVLATWKKYEDRTLTLETADGREIEISIDRISSADQSYAVKKIRSARRKATTAESVAENQNREADVLASVQEPIEPLESNTALPNVGQRPLEPTVGNPKPRFSTGDLDTLYGVDWHSMDKAEQIAAQRDKPIMWFRVLGDLTGFM